MPLRDRLRNAFGNREPSTLSTTNTNTSTTASSTTFTTPQTLSPTAYALARKNVPSFNDMISPPSSGRYIDEANEADAAQSIECNSLAPVETTPQPLISSLSPPKTTSFLKRTFTSPASSSSQTPKDKKGKKEKKEKPPKKPTKKQIKAAEAAAAKAAEEAKWKDWPEHIYKPHEIPAPRYKRTPDPKHVRDLESYSWAKASSGEGSLRGGLGGGSGNTSGSLAGEGNGWLGVPSRKRSMASLYSPMGSRLPSARCSVASLHRLVGPHANNDADADADADIKAQEQDADAVTEGEGEAKSTTARRQHSPSSMVPMLSTSASTASTAGSAPDLVPLVTDGTASEESSVLLLAVPTYKTDAVSGGVGSAKPFDEEELVRALSRSGIVGDEE